MYLLIKKNQLLFFNEAIMFCLQYEAVTVPYPKDTKTTQIDQHEKELVRLCSYSFHLFVHVFPHSFSLSSRIITGISSHISKINIFNNVTSNSPLQINFFLIHLLQFVK